jgi:hypothetical protein
MKHNKDAKEFIRGLMELGESEEEAKRILANHLKQRIHKLSKKQEEELIKFIDDLEL